MDSLKENTEKLQLDGPVVVACVVFQSRDAEHLLALFRKAIAALADHASVVRPGWPTAPPQAEPEDPWLKHFADAEYLGISTTTLHKYASGLNAVPVDASSPNSSKSKDTMPRKTDTDWSRYTTRRQTNWTPRTGRGQWLRGHEALQTRNQVVSKEFP